MVRSHISTPSSYKDIEAINKERMKLKYGKEDESHAMKQNTQDEHELKKFKKETESNEEDDTESWQGGEECLPGMTWPLPLSP